MVVRSSSIVKSNTTTKRTTANISYLGHSALTPMERWEFMLKKVLFMIRNNAKFHETSFSAAANMVIKKEVKTKIRERKLNIIGRWAWMTRKLVHFRHRRS